MQTLKDRNVRKHYIRSIGSAGSASSPAATPDIAAPAKAAAALLVAEVTALEPVPLAVAEAPDAGRDAEVLPEALVVFPAFSDAAPVPETAPAVIVMLINWRSLPVSVALVEVDV